MHSSNPHKSPSIGSARSEPKIESVEQSLNFMNRLDQRFEIIASRVAGLDKLIEDGKLSSLQAASAELASVISDLKVLKAEEDKVDCWSLKLTKFKRLIAVYRIWKKVIRKESLLGEMSTVYSRYSHTNSL
jgi:hypothetical protein